MKICIAGKNNIAVNSVDFLINEYGINKESVVICLNQNDTGIDTWQKSLKKYAIENNIEILSLTKIQEIDELYFLSLEFDKLVKMSNFKTDKLYNIHFSKLPAYKGMYTSIFPILYGEKEAGVTFHMIDDGIDTGNIISQKKFGIDLNDTARDLYFKFLDNSFELFKETIADVLTNQITSTPQTHLNSSYFSKKSIDFKKITINFNKTSFEIHNQIRAFIFPEYQLPIVNDFKIIKTKLFDEYIGRNLFKEYEDKFIVSGIDGYRLELIKFL